MGLLIVCCAHVAHAAEDIRINGAADEKRIKGKSTIYYTIPADAEMVARVAGPATVTLKLAGHRLKKRGPASAVAITIDGQPYEEVRLPCRPTSLRFSVGPAHPCKPVANVIVLEEGEHEIGFRITKSEHGVSVQISVEAATAAAQAVEEDLPSLELAVIEDIWDDKGGGGQEPAEPPVGPAKGETVTAAPTTETTPTEVKTDGPAPSPVGRALGNPITWVAIGAGVVAAGVGIYFGSDSQQRYNNLVQNRPTQVAGERAAKKASTSALIANLLFVTAGVAGLTGGLLFYLDLSAAPAGPEAGAATAAAPGATETTSWKLGVSLPF